MPSSGPGLSARSPDLLRGRQAFDRGELHALVGRGPTSDGRETGSGRGPDRRDQGPGHLRGVGQRGQPLAHRQERERHPGLMCEVLARRQELDRNSRLDGECSRQLAYQRVHLVGLFEEEHHDPCHAVGHPDRQREPGSGAVADDSTTERPCGRVVGVLLVAREAALEDFRVERLDQSAARPVRARSRGEHRGRPVQGAEDDRAIGRCKHRIGSIDDGARELVEVGAQEEPVRGMEQRLGPNRNLRRVEH